jgi:uncharacterized repeat protein (TIGR02543 family)
LTWETGKSGKKRAEVMAHRIPGGIPIDDEPPQVTPVYVPPNYTPPPSLMCTVTYSANRGSGTPPPARMVNTGSPVMLESGSRLYRSGYTFSGWSTNPFDSSGTRYSVGDFFVPRGNTLLYAIWTSSPPWEKIPWGKIWEGFKITAGIIILILGIGATVQECSSPSKPTVLTAPSNIRSSNVNTDRITIQWNGTDSGLSYKIYYSPQNNQANARTTTATGTSVTVTGLASNTTYYFWVTAIKDKEESVKSPVLTVKTSSTTSPPPANTINGTTWEYINQNDSGNRYRLSFSGSNSVTFAIYNRDGSRQLEAYNGTYWLQGTNLIIEIVYPNEVKMADYYTYSQSGITNKQKQSIIYKKR